MRVLITGFRAPVAVTLARALKQAGVAVDAAESVLPHFGQYTNAVDAVHTLPPPNRDPNAFADTLARIAEERGIDAIVPVNEETFWVSAVRDCLPQNIAVFCPPLETLERLHHKGRAMEFAKSLGIATPTTRAEPDFSVDGVMKRAYSRFSQNVVPLLGGETQRHAAFATIDRADNAGWVWQEWISGRQVCSYSVCRDGEVLAHAAYETPFRVGLGAGIAYRALDNSAFSDTLDMASRLAAATGYTGQLSLDTIDNGGRLHLIEVNPRATMGAALLADTPGFPDALRAALGDCAAPGNLVCPAAGAVRQLRGAMLLHGLRQPDRAWWNTLRHCPDVLDSVDDPAPGRAALFVWGNYVVQAKRLGLDPIAFTTHDIAWDGPGNGPHPPGPLSQRLSSPSGDPSEPLWERGCLWCYRCLAPPLPGGPEVRNERRVFGRGGRGGEGQSRRGGEGHATHRLAELAGVPRLPLLAPEPTPVERLCGLTDRADVWVKRDDLACPRYGGNKARKFEWILGALKASGKRGFWTVGGLCSNHCTAAAVYGRAADVEVYLGFVPTPINQTEADELRWQASLGATQSMLNGATLTRWASDRGLAFVPPAGSSVEGVLGYVAAGLELAAQIACGAMPNPDEIWIAAATGGTAHGLAIGLALAGIAPCPKVVMVETVTPLWQRSRVLLPTSQRCLDRLRKRNPSLRAQLPTRLDALHIDRVFGHDREPLGVVTAPIADAIRRGADCGITLEPHFSARAFAALLLALDTGRLDNRTILFWQTHGHLDAGALDRARSTPLPPDVARATQKGLTLP